jgi:hypothetical protein
VEDAKSEHLQTASRGKQVVIVAAMVAIIVVLFLLYLLLTKTTPTDATPTDDSTSPPVVASLLESIPTVELPQLPQLLWAENASSTESLVE